MAMTLKQAKAEVAALGYRLHYSPEFREYVVAVPANRKADYFTDDREDAVATARAMAEQRAQVRVGGAR